MRYHKYHKYHMAKEGRELPDAPLSAPAAHTTPDGLDERSVSRRVDQLRLRARDAVDSAARCGQAWHKVSLLQHMRVATANEEPYGLARPACLTPCCPWAFACFPRLWRTIARAPRRGRCSMFSVEHEHAHRTKYPIECQCALPGAA